MLTLNQVARAGDIDQDRQTGSQTLTNRLPSSREHRGEIGETGGFRHRRRFVVVDARAELRVGAGIEQNLRGKQVAFGDRHVKRRVVVDAALIRIGPVRQQQPQDLVDVRRFVAPGTSRAQHNAAISGGNPSSTGAFGFAPSSRSVRMKVSGLW